MTSAPTQVSYRSFLWICLLITIKVSAQSLCEARDRAALLAFYNALDGPNWVNNTNWNTANPLDSWFGVQTDANGCVIRIDFNSVNIPGGNGLQGSLPEEVGELTDLQYLSLMDHNISGPIPSTLGNLSRLQYLNLSNNQLSGEIPGSLGNLAALEVLFLGYNQLSGTLPWELGNLQELRMLLAEGNQFTGELPNSLGYLSNLETLWLGGNQLEGELPETFIALTKLQSLGLGINKLTGPLPDIWDAMPALTSLRLDRNQLSGELPESLSRLNNLNNLNLNNNLFSGTLPLNFQNLHNLSSLFLQNNRFEGRIPDLSGTNIQFFHIQGNRFQFGDFESEFVTYTNNLSVFADNPQSKIGLDETMAIVEGGTTSFSVECSGNFNTYQWFKDGVMLTDGGSISGSNTDTLTINNATGADAGIYHCEINNTVVTDLTLLSNNFTLDILTGPCNTRDRAALTAIFNALDGPNWVNNTNWNTSAPLNTWFGVSTDGNGCVIEVDLNATNTPEGNNGLSGMLPDELGYLLNLQFLDLTYQDISGPLPKTLGNLSNLLWMELDKNKLNGTIPKSFGNLDNLELLSIRNNELSGPLPDELGDMVSLKYMVMDDNQISGVLPESLGQLTDLEVLWLGGNHLEGVIPDSFSNLVSLSQILLNRNRLTGVIPDFWNNMPKMEVIWMNNNSLSGEIPQSIFQLGNLEQLLLNNNQLTGTISQNFQLLRNLEVLYLGENSFHGSLPPELGNLSRLRELGIYRTNMEGEIPTELGQLRNLEILWLLGNNHTGTIPDSFSQLENLVQLNVEENSLTGTIPQDLNQIASLKLLSIEDNLIEGPIPDFSETGLIGLVFGSNRFQFGDFENQFDYYVNTLEYFGDNPQAKINDILSIKGNIGESITLHTEASGQQNHYQWFKDGVRIPGAPDSPTLTLSNLQEEDEGVYYAEVRSDIVTDLILTRNDITVSVGCTIPTADTLTDITACESYVLPGLSATSNYFTDTNGGGTPLFAGDIIRSSQTVYIYSGQGSCADESSFEITIVEKPVVDTLENVMQCEGYILPIVENGYFYSQPGGTGTSYYAGDIINSSQTVYIFSDNGVCSTESSFTVTIDASQCESPETSTALFPNFFTPNNDGSNDYWKVNTFETALEGYVYIYDRYGKLLSQIDILDGAWDGTYRGVDMPAATYWYTFEDSSAGSISNGFFALVR